MLPSVNAPAACAHCQLVVDSMLEAPSCILFMQAGSALYKTPHAPVCRSLILEHAVYYVASPEACAAILWKSRDKAATVRTLPLLCTLCCVMPAVQSASLEPDAVTVLDAPCFGSNLLHVLHTCMCRN